MATEQTVKIRVPSDVAVASYGIVYAGVYSVTMPGDYDPALVTAEDMVMDDAITVAGPDSFAHLDGAPVIVAREA